MDDLACDPDCWLLQLVVEVGILQTCIYSLVSTLVMSSTFRIYINYNYDASLYPCSSSSQIPPEIENVNIIKLLL